MEKMDRSKFLGASEISACMGLSRYTTPLKLWALKTGRIQREEQSEAAEWGTRLEKVVAEKFSEKNDKKLMRHKRRFTHKDYPFISCELDYVVVGSDEIVEVKTCNEYVKKDWQGDELPREYCIQINTCLGLSGRNKGHFALLIGGQKYLEKTVEFDQELYDMTISKAVQFWNDYIIGDMVPVATAGDNDETLDLLFPQSQEGLIEFEGETAQEINVLLDDRAGATESIKHAKEELDKVEARLKQLLGEKESGQTDNYIFTWKTQSRVSADIEKLKAEGLYDKYTKSTTFRVLRQKQRG